MDPTRVNAGLPPDVAARVRSALREETNIVRIEILFNLKTGVCRVGAPMDPILFHGILEAARDTHKALVRQAQMEAQDKRIVAPGEGEPQ